VQTPTRAEKLIWPQSKRNAADFLRAVKEKGGLNNPPFFHIIAAVIEGKLFSFSAFN